MGQGQPLIFGEVLFDCFPDGREVLGGAPFNVAWNLQAFGQKPILISRVGGDPQGQLIRETMTSWSMNTDFLQYDLSLPTGRVDISLTYGEPRFAILPNQAYDHVSSIFPQLKEKPAFLYHGSLALRDEGNRIALEELKRTLSPIFLDVNLRTPWWSRDAVLDMIKDATWLKLSDEECRDLFPDEQNIHACGPMILDRFDLDAVFITRGSKGAASFTRNDSPNYVEPSVSIEVIDTVGAGDAFSSVLLLGLMRDWPLQITLDRAQEFASAVVGQRGATTQDRSFYQTLYDKWIQQ